MEELAKYGSAGVAVILAGIIFYIIKFGLKEFLSVLRGLSRNVQDNTKVTTEMHKFMKKLNGDLNMAVKKRKK